MGVRGWNRFLSEHGFLPPDQRHSNSIGAAESATAGTDQQQQQQYRTCCSTSLWNELRVESTADSKYERIPSGSTFHIDGLGLCSHIIETAYARHMNSVLYSKLNHIERPCCRIQTADLSVQQARQLNPSYCIPYSLLHEVTKEFITTIQRQCNVQMIVYWDGSQRYIYKQSTDIERGQGKEQQWDNLHQYCMNGTLPPDNEAVNSATTTPSKPRKKKNNGSNNNKTLPLCAYFTQKFPFSKLYTKQIYYTLHILHNVPKYLCVNEADAVLASTVYNHYKSNVNSLSSTVQKHHYIVGYDSDFCFYPNCVQYIPISTLQVHKSENIQSSSLPAVAATSYVMGCVITREKLASILHLQDTNLMIEIAILFGNDYISPTTVHNNHQWMNDTILQPTFDLFHSNNNGNSTKKNKQQYDYTVSMDRILYFIQNQSSTFQLRSSNPEIERSILFIRQMYNLQLPINENQQESTNGIYEQLQLRSEAGLIAAASESNNNGADVAESVSLFRPHLTDDEMAICNVTFTAQQRTIKDTIVRSFRNYMNFSTNKTNSDSNDTNTHQQQSPNTIIVLEEHCAALEQLNITSGDKNNISYNTLDQKVKNRNWRPSWNDILVVYLIEKIIMQCIEQLQSMTTITTTTTNVAATTTMKILYKISSPHITFDPYSYFVQLNMLREMNQNINNSSSIVPHISSTNLNHTTVTPQIAVEETHQSSSPTPKKKWNKKGRQKKASQGNENTNTTASILNNGGSTNNNISHQSSAIVEEGEYEVDAKDDAEKEVEEERLVLPVDEFEHEIIESVYKNRVTIIQGETGCGKSTRIPIMLLQAPPPPDSIHIESKIFVSQPRRIAAKSLVERLRKVEPDFRDKIALRMGHGVREYESKQTRAYFVTTGYLVRLVANVPDVFLKVTYLVIDEVHERSVDTDILCLLCRRMLHEYPHIRLVLMSATLAASLYQEYFNVAQPVIKVGARRFPVTEVYLSDILTKAQLPGNKSKNVKWLSEECLKLKCLQPPPPTYTEKLLSTAASLATVIGTPGTSVLIFVTGMNDIVSIIDSVEMISVPGTTFTCIPIHSDIPFEDQMTAFDQAKSDEVKIIIATNAAESSVTLPDVDNVICLGLCKQIEYNPTSHRQMLVPTWISKASATQRAGRTGRVRPGTVYRLYEREIFEKHMEAFEQGEMVRIPLDNVILTLKQMISDEAVTDVLTNCLEPPNLSTIERSFKSLFSSHFISSESDDESCEITQLGLFVSTLGIDLTLGSLVGLGIQFGVGAEAIQLAGILSFPKSPWVQSNPLFHEPNEFNDMTSTTYSSRCHFDANLFSEPMAVMNMLWDYNQIPASSEHKWCKKQGIFLPRLKRLNGTCDTLSRRVAEFLKMPYDAIQVQEPPRSMSHGVVTILRVIQFWVFHDTLIQFDPKNIVQIQAGCDDVVLKLQGHSDRIQKKHLEAILKVPERHPFSFIGESVVETKGSFPFDVQHLNMANQSWQLNLIEMFQERLISYSTEKEVDFYVVECKDSCAIYFPERIKEEILKRLPASHRDNVTLCSFTANPHPTGKKLRGRDERPCGLRKVNEGFNGENPKALHVSRIVFPGSYKSCLNSSVDYFETKFPKRIHLMFPTNERLDTTKIGVLKFSLVVCGIVNGMSDLDLKDLFESTDIKTTKRELPVPQKLLFSIVSHLDHDSGSSWDRPPIPCVPEAARLLSVLASSRRGHENVIKLPIMNDTNRNNEETSSKTDSKGDNTKTLDIYLDASQNIMNRWKRFGDLKSKVYLEANSVPASAVPLHGNEMLFCTCANALEIRGATSIKVDGLTLLPPGKLFLQLCRFTWGLYKQENIDDGSYIEKTLKLVDPDGTGPKKVKKILKQRIMDAVHFHKSSIALGEKLICFPDKMKELIDIFNGVDGYFENNDKYDIASLSNNPFTFENIKKARQSLVDKQTKKEVEDLTARLMFTSI